MTKRHNQTLNTWSLLTKFHSDSLSTTLKSTHCYDISTALWRCVKSEQSSTIKQQ